NQVEGLLFSRVNVAMIHGRGCLDPDEGDEGNGNMCPRLIRNLIPAIDRSGARSAIKLGMFDDTGSYQGARNRVRGYPEGTRFDFADHADALYFFWDLNMKIWFDMVPRDLWYLQEGRPVVAFWTASEYFFQNNQGNSSILLRSLRARFIERYGMDPWFNVDDSWIKLDSTITTNDVQAINGWFGPPQNTGTFRQWAGKTWGAITPSFRDSPTLPGCGAACREVPRGTLGSNFLNYLTQHVTLRSIFTLIEGFTDTVEGNGLYRSDVWDYPSLYLNLVREHADPETRTLRFQAEAADRYSDRDTENRGGQFRDGGLDVGNIDGPDAGWFVGWTDPGEWIQYERIQTGFASYRFTIRYATPLDGQRVRLEIDGRSLGTVTLPRTGDWQKWGYWQLGNRFLLPGKHTIRLVFETGGVNADWFFLKRL
ncbi:MAG TPA: DUF5010 domain-containing protein, partial [Bdellovibrionota bacterium]|nr:DUF5010 domain-containing protein [Bdellovibrionota bacterium]